MKLLNISCVILPALILVACAGDADPRSSAAATNPPAAATVHCPLPDLPQQLQLAERLFTWSTILDVKSGGQAFGTLNAKPLALAAEISYLDQADRLVATGYAKLFSWGVEITVEDCEGNVIATVNEDIWQTVSTLHTVYKINGPGGQQLATSDKLDIVTPDFSFTDGSGRETALISRQWPNFPTDTWNVKVSGSIDPRVVLMIGAFKSDAENRGIFKVRLPWRSSPFQ